MAAKRPNMLVLQPTERTLKAKADGKPDKVTVAAELVEDAEALGNGIAAFQDILHERLQGLSLPAEPFAVVHIETDLRVRLARGESKGGGIPLITTVRRSEDADFEISIKVTMQRTK